MALDAMCDACVERAQQGASGRLDDRGLGVGAGEARDVLERAPARRPGALGLAVDLALDLAIDDLGSEIAGRGAQRRHDLVAEVLEVAGGVAAARPRAPRAVDGGRGRRR